MVVVAGLVLDRQAETINQERVRSEVLGRISVIRAKLEGHVSSNVQLVRGLVSVISTEPDMDQARFDALVGNLFEEDSQLRSVAAAPDLVIRMTYPLEGNEKAIGLDYRQTPNQWDAVQQVLFTGKMVLAGPVDLVQGGRGFVGRFPVYTTEGGWKKFWGVVSAVIDTDRLYKDSGLYDPSVDDLDISITGHDSQGGHGKLFYGDSLTGRQPVLANVTLPSGSWQIAAVPKAGWQSGMMSQFMLRGAIFIAGCLILLPFVIAGRMISQRHDYIAQLRAREAELTQQTQRLNLALETSKVGLWELDLATGEEVWDARTNEIYGMSVDSGGRTHDHWQKVVHPEDKARAESEFRTSIANGRYQSDYRIVLPDGTTRHIRSIAVLYRAPGEDDRVMGINWDVTADVALSEDLRRAKALTEARNTELEAARVRIEHNALHDSLTGLPNRRYLDEMLRSNAAGGYGGSGTIALLHIDLDRFKQINDTLGHAAGDAMLIHASKVLRESCRDTDFVARIGGDEFVVVSSNSHGEEGLARLAGRLVESMRKPVMHEGHECRCGVSVGIATGMVPAIDVEQLLINADIALYRAKDRGRNRFEFFSAALQAEVINTKRVADEILSSLENHDFVAHYQPQFDARTLDVVGVEALARWRHPTLGLRSPDSFMEIAEELSVVAAIDHAILQQGLKDLERWDRMGLRVPRVSVNVSQRRLHDENLVAALREMDLPEGRVAFELVESIYLDESDGVIAWNIEQIKALGIDVEIDDFGTGYASIVSLQKLHPRRLKIDRQLVDPIITEPGQRRLVASIVDIGKSMDIEIVAEGVETMEHAKILRDLGCDILQGYAFAKPMPREALEGFLLEQSWRRAS
ncbi:bifunctional diguanylate cyclase/phosphodiesterase [Devosia riboflavina]|uniref:bifunctional diguanylate cyclase/phosphodiesterase n=1 Tax=Devosia riboflavina TaxID=46914 RepID=UPI00313781B6